MTYIDDNHTFLSIFKKWMSFAVILAVILQNIFFFTAANLIGAFFVLLSWCLMYNLVLKIHNFRKYTLSSFLILGFYFTQFGLPVIFTILEGKPLIFNLDYPVSVFIHSFLAFLGLLGAFIFYKNHNNPIRKFLTSFLKKLNFYNIPTKLQFWIIGIMGLSSIVVQRVIFGGYGEDEASSEFLSFIQGMQPYAYLPLLLLFPAVFSDSENYGKLKAPLYLVVIYIAVLVILGMMANSRGLFMRGITTVGLVYFLGLILGSLDFRILKARNVIIAFLGIWLITGPLSDLGTAMVSIRGIRGDIPPKALMEETFRTYQDKDALRTYRKLANVQITDWDETYFDNIFLARFSNLKFSDASLHQAFQIKNPDGQMQDVVYGKYLSLLPQPLLNLLGVPLDKDFYANASFGDFLYMRNSGVGYGGFRTGNFLGMGLASFGWWYLGVLFIGAILLFNFIDSFVLYERESYHLSVIGLLSILFCFTYFGVSTPSESVTNSFHYITRGWMQTVLLYVLLFWIARKVSRVL